jgi:membrane-bound metal-dependent hydrolase YbcI (DUF457 family)
MWPWAHAGAGYLIYSLSCRRRGVRPQGMAVVLLGFATQLPDLIDKPFAWTIPLLPGGRTLGHTLLVALPLVAVVSRYASSRGSPRLGVAFGIGYLSHLLSDGLATLITDSLGNTMFLLWPLLPPPTWGTAPSFVAHLKTLQLTPWIGCELALTAAATAMWMADGLPGLKRPQEPICPN